MTIHPSPTLVSYTTKTGRSFRRVVHVARHDLSGDSIGRWKVLRRDKSRQGKTYWICKCSCGVVRSVWHGNLSNGASSSCGCAGRRLASKRMTRHGLHGTDTYACWQSMLSRCYNGNNPSFSHYGGRGITVCDEWRKSFSKFVEDMGERPSGLTLERVCNFSGYSKDNCVWASRSAQSNNRRNTKRIEINGCIIPLSIAARSFGIKYQTAHARLKRGLIGRDIVAPVKAKLNP